MKKTKGKRKSEPESIILPEVKDIPGQENIRPPRIREMEDTTISSSGEEGEGILDELNSEEENNLLFNDDDLNVTDAERDLLNRTDRPSTDEQADREKMKLDDTDGEDPLNEEANPSDMGEDLDVPGAELDDEDEDIGEEDEENNAYSQSQKDS